MSKPNGRSKARPRAADLAIDRREIEAELRRNREANERFLREYSAWFERQPRPRSRKRPPA